jgi:3',5'-cyclic AMP phosphodiesterase CpdA
MKTLIHLSDLHFGTEFPGVTDILINEIKNIRPDLLVISGDLTQRARHAQFAKAKKFLAALQQYPLVCVPGNHDISLYNPLERFLYPFAKYKKWIFKTLSSQWTDENLAVLGISSVTPYKPMSGYITTNELELIKGFFAKFPDHFIKIIVMHHNLIRSVRHEIINDSEKIIEIFSNLEINLVLSGHIHQSRVELLKHKRTKNLYVVTAGTAISSRTIDPNSFNILKVDQEKFILTVQSYHEGQFVSGPSNVYLF